jgi:hypothetical protein
MIVETLVVLSVQPTLQSCLRSLRGRLRRIKSIAAYSQNPSFQENARSARD